MKYLRGFALALLFFISACQPKNSTVTIIDNGNIHTLQTTERMPSNLLTQAGIIPGKDDRVLFNGIVVPLDQPLPEASSFQLQIRRAVALTLVTPQGQITLQTSALTIGQALHEVNVNLTRADYLDPPAETPLTQDITVNYVPARELRIFAGGKTLQTFSSAQTVGEALTEAGISLVGADISSPAESDALPADGNIRVVRVYEAVKVTLESLPFTTEKVEDQNLPMGEEQIVQPGVNGLAMIRTRIRYEDGKEVSRVTEGKTVLREPQKQIVKGGSQIVMSQMNGMNYWLATQMYATVYSPCASGTGGCSYGTASGARAGYGIVAVDYSIYSYLAGMKVYIPGYGTATIGDTGGGPIIETQLGVARTKWIDLGFNDGEIKQITGWVTVYFLAPAPAEVPDFLK